MKIPQWKRWVSHFVPLTLEESGSRYNPYIGVRLSKGRLQLVSANAIYSFEDLYINFDLAYKRIRWEAIGKNRLLILGFGFGSALQLLQKHRVTFRSVTAVELDEEVLYLANKYLGHKWSDTAIEYVAADAFEYISRDPTLYDMIIMDVFEDDLIPEKFQQLEFLNYLKARLHPGGLILYNTLADSKEDIDRSLEFYNGRFCAAFPDGGYLDVAQNYMLYNSYKLIV